MWFLIFAASYIGLEELHAETLGIYFYDEYGRKIGSEFLSIYKSNLM